jgi:formylglycine-generating enzyme required for sulfatase activity
LTTIRVEDGGRSRALGPADFPVPLGGAGSPVPVAGSGGPLAWLGLADGEVFLQPSPGASVVCNGTRLSASHWLRDGDALRLGPTRVEVSVRADGMRLVVLALAEENPTEPPVVLVPPPRDERLSPEDATPGAPIQPIDYKPRRTGPAPRPRTAPRGRTIALAGLLLVAAALAFFVSQLATFGVVVEPEPDAVALRGRWPVVRLASRFVALPGSYTLVAEKDGYRRLEAPVEVTGEPGQVIALAMRLLPGRLTVDTGGVAGAEVALDGRTVGETPLAAFEAEAGEREVRVRADGYEELRARVAIEGRGKEQRLAVALVALPTPPPAKAPPPAPGVLVVRSDPSGARVEVDGVDRGETPLELAVEPDREHAIRLTKEGHDEASVSARLRAGVRHEQVVRLAPRLGEVKVAARPPDAELFVDGRPAGRADQTLQLLAVPHEIEIRREGYESVKQAVTPRPGFPQTVSVALKSREEVREEKTPRVARSPEGHEMRLVEGGTFKLGASRREPGRRANEPLRDVSLARRFYVATREVSNLQFRRFQPGHTSGRVGAESLDLDDQPVVRVTWQQAAAYCNWLSEREGLPKVYVEREGRLQAAAPVGTGYRLPTEAEWERVARYPGGAAALKYPWGPSLPVPPGAGNYADAKARGLVAQVLDGYDDGVAATAPVQSMGPNALGFLHLGGNVAEWTHDLYSIMPSVEGQLARDPVGPAEGEYHVIRGASFLQATVTELRLSYRDYGKDARPDVGFRVARYAE